MRRLQHYFASLLAGNRSEIGNQLVEYMVGRHPQATRFLIDLHESGRERTPDRQMLHHQLGNAPATAE